MMNNKLDKPRLCWTRHELVTATGLSYRTLINLEKRGLLLRCLVEVNVACYTDASVRALFEVGVAGPDTGRGGSNAAQA